MRRSFLLGALALSLLVAGCASKSEVDSKLTELESRVKTLEDQVKQLNSQVSALSTLLSGKYLVQSVSELSDGSGYTLVLVDSDGKTVQKTIHNGKDGTSPVIGVKKDSDGNYYWTVNGDWLKVDGQKVRASGEDGLTPEFKVEGGKWYVKLGSGAWTYAGDAVTEGSCPIVGVDAGSRPDVVVFTLADGTVLEVPRAMSVKLQIVVNDNAFLNMKKGESRSVNYEVKVPTGITYSLSSFEPQGWKVVISEPVSNKGTIALTLPENAEDGKVLLIVTGSDGSCFLKVLIVGMAEGPVHTSYQVDSKAGTLNLPDGVKDLKNASAVSWIKIKGTSLLIGENTSYDSRSAIVTYTLDGVKFEAEIVQAQRDAIVLQASSVEVSALNQDFVIIVSTNVEVEATSDAEWLTVGSKTKGLEDRICRFSAQFNPGTDRTAQVTFSAGDLQQSVKVIQKTVEEEPVVACTEPGCYLNGGSERVYVAGSDQYCRSYDGQELSFVILNPEQKEQMEIKGYNTSMKPGNPVHVSVCLTRDEEPESQQTYEMTLLKESEDLVWLGNSAGQGIVIRK